MKESLNHAPGAKPLYAQLYEILLKKLHTGEYKKDSVLPTEAEFQELFGVSRITARRALAELVNQGYLKRERGIGTLVIRNSEKQSINVKMTLVERQGKKVERKNLSLETIIPNQEISQAFDMDSKDSLQRLTRLIYRGDVATQINYIHLSPKLGLLTLDDFANGLYVALENRGQDIHSYKDFITAEMPSEEEKSLLSITDQTPLLVRTRIGYNDDHQAIEYSTAKHISKYYQYIVENL